MIRSDREDGMIDVRPVAARDEAAWRPLWRAYLAFYGAELPEAVVRTSFARLVDPAIGDYRGLLAERGGEAVGIAHFIFHLHGWRIEPVCYLQDLFVAEAARGGGAGRALIEGVYRAADAAGARAVYWLTQADNVAARRLYDRVGRVTPFIKYVR